MTAMRYVVEAVPALPVEPGLDGDWVGVLESLPLQPIASSNVANRATENTGRMNRTPEIRRWSSRRSSYQSP
jgi:hypothetical protein